MTDPVASPNQSLENRNFDKALSVHQEKISSLEKNQDRNSDELESIKTRMRSLENFKYVMIGIGIIAGLILPPLIRTIIDSFK